MEGVLVSIIIPVFNVRPYIAEAIESAVKQTYRNLEIIVIDDGSTDGSGGICDSFAIEDQRIRVIHQDNRGLSAARNVGLNLSTGNVITFLDADDVYHPQYVETMLSAMAREEVDLVICKYQVHRATEKMSFNDKVKATPVIEEGVYNRIQSLNSLADGSINPMVWNKLYKRELWNGIRFPEGRVHEDIDTTYRILDECQKIYVVSDPLYLRRIRAGSIISSTTRSNAEDCILALNHFEKFVRSNTPGTFGSEHLKHVRQYKLDWMIRYYVKLMQKNEDKAFCDKLRESIVTLRKSTGLRDADLLRILRYWLICYCPWILRIVYSAYKGIQKTVMRRGT